MKTDPKFDRHLSGLYNEPQEMFEAGDLVSALVAHEGWLHVTRLLEFEVAEIDRMLDGRDEPLTQAQYAHWHGRRDGLRAAQRAADAIIARAQREYERQRARHESGAGSPLNGG